MDGHLVCIMLIVPRMLPTDISTSDLILGGGGIFHWFKQYSLDYFTFILASMNGGCQI